MVKRAEWLLEADRAREAKDLLRPALQHHTEPELYLLLAKAYLALDNTVWARKVLFQGAQRHGKSCQIRSWLIWIHLKNAQLEEAASLLEEPGCPTTGPMAARWRLLSATLSRYRKERDQAKQALEVALESDDLYPEDHPLAEDLKAYAYDPSSRQPPVSLHLDLGGGYTTNGLSSSPADLPNPDVRTGSPALSVDLLARLEPPWSLYMNRRRVRPLLELGLRSMVLTAGQAVSSRETIRDYSYLDLGLKPGLALGPVHLFYSTHLFLLTGGDSYGGGPRAFFETHRGELEWEPADWITLFAAAGRAIFREQARTRSEMDGGAGLFFGLGPVRLLTGITLRGHVAEHRAYGLFGGTALGSATLPVGSFSLRLRFISSFDLYLDSADYFKLDQNNYLMSSRRDLLLKGGAEAWTGDWHGLRFGVSYEVTGRISTATPYEYVDHRILARLRFRTIFNPWAPGVAARSKGYVALPYGISEATGKLEDERIQDLLRQEDAVRRGSSCVN